MYKCKKCGKEFPVVAWIEGPYIGSTGSTIKVPCCPFCHEREIGEVKG